MTTDLDSFRPYTEGSDGYLTTVASWSLMAEQYCVDGIVAGEGDEFALTLDGSFDIEVGTGGAVLNGIHGEVGSVSTEITETISAADPTNDRIDLVVIRNNTAQNKTQLHIIEGTPGSGTPAWGADDLPLYSLGIIANEATGLSGAYVASTNSGLVADYRVLRTNAGIWVKAKDVFDSLLPMGALAKGMVLFDPTAADGAALWYHNGTAWQQMSGHIARLVHTSTSTFDRTDYPGAAKLFVQCVGGGGGGGGHGSTGASGNASSGGGGGGGYSSEWLTVADLTNDEEDVTVGAAGSAGSGGNGGNGGTSSFGDTPYLSASGGDGGTGGTNTASGHEFAGGGQGGIGSSGTMNLRGDDGGNGVCLEGLRTVTGHGGGTVFAGKQAQANNAGGSAGHDYGGGGAGASSAANESPKTGGAGAAGVVIIDVWA